MKLKTAPKAAARTMASVALWCRAYILAKNPVPAKITTVLKKCGVIGQMRQMSVSDISTRNKIIAGVGPITMRRERK